MKLGKFSIGPLEVLLTVSAFLELNPILQAIKIMQLRQAEDVSPWTFAMILTIGVMWLVYGIKIKSLPLIAGNSIKLFSSLVVLIAYCMYAT